MLACFLFLNKDRKISECKKKLLNAKETIPEFVLAKPNTFSHANKRRNYITKLWGMGDKELVSL